MKNLFLVVIVALCLFSCKKEANLNVEESVDGQFLNIFPLTSVQSLPKGADLTVRTVWTGDEVVDLKAKFVAVADGMLAPLSLYMVEGTDPKFVQMKGATAGMSGSPVLYDGKIIGALSYGYDGQENPPFYFFVTPIEYMINPPYALNEKKAEIINHTKSANKKLFCEISTPLVGSGLKPQAIDFMNGTGSNGPLSMDVLASGSSDQNVNKMIPGSSIVMCVITGDQITLGAVGSVTYIDKAGSIYAFGHPFFGTGKIDCPYTSATILGEVSNSSGSFKLGVIGKDVLGTIEYDGTTGIKGRIGVTPQMIQINSGLTLADGRTFNFHHQSIKNGLPIPELSYYAACAAYVPLMNITNNSGNHSLVTRTKIHFAETDRILDQVSISIEDSDWGLLSKSASYQMSIHSDLFNFGQLTATKIEVESKLVNSVMKSTIIDLKVDTAGIWATNEFKVWAILQGDKAGKYEKKFAMPKDYKQAYLNISAGPKKWPEPNSLSQYLDRLDDWEGFSTLEIKIVVSDPLLKDDSILKTEWNLQTVIFGDKQVDQEVNLK